MAGDGMKITALKAQVKNPDRVSVFVDGKFAFGLTLSQVAELGVKNNKTITGEELKNLQKQSGLGKAHMRTIEWLMRRPRSRRELSDYLRRKKYEEDEKEYITSKVERYLDDEAFARFWVEGRRSVKNKSARSIKAELSQKGIPTEISDKVLTDNDISDTEVLQKLITKKQRQTKYQDNKRLIEYLLRQGFAFDDINAALVEVSQPKEHF